jgi:hypothetical protein
MAAVDQFKVDMIANLKLKTDEIEELESTLSQSQYEVLHLSFII